MQSYFARIELNKFKRKYGSLDARAKENQSELIVRLED